MDNLAGQVPVAKYLANWEVMGINILKSLAVSPDILGRRVDLPILLLMDVVATQGPWTIVGKMSCEFPKNNPANQRSEHVIEAREESVNSVETQETRNEGESLLMDFFNQIIEGS